MQNFFTRHFESIVTIICIVMTGIFWLATMNGIPNRVTKLEAEVSEIKQQLSKNDTKTDIMLEDIKFIKQVVIQKQVQ